jgi:acid stress chaperone HdeB
MKQLIALTVAAIVWSALPAEAEQLDLSTVKCRQFLQSSKENIALVLMWLEGYYSEEDAQPVVDFDQMSENSKKLGEYCGKNPEHSVITAAEKVMGGDK